MTTLSNTKIDRLGNRLRNEGPIVESDLVLLDEYRRLFRNAYDDVVNRIRNQLNVQTTGRPAKSTGSIRDKLLRESVRLSQVQDIAGCRIVVADILEQDRVVLALRSLFADSNLDIVDRRKPSKGWPRFGEATYRRGHRAVGKPSSNGYRAVHIMVHLHNRVVEIQIRTLFQNWWAELSEKLSDSLRDPSIKYGGGPANLRHILSYASNAGANIEATEKHIGLTRRLIGSSSLESREELEATLKEFQEASAELRLSMSTNFQKRISNFYDISD